MSGSSAASDVYKGQGDYTRAVALLNKVQWGLRVRARARVRVRVKDSVLGLARVSTR